MQKEPTVGFHGKSGNAAGEIVDDLVCFLKADFSISSHKRKRVAEKARRTPAKGYYKGSLDPEDVGNVQPALKHSWPQKNEPAIPSLHGMRL